MKPVKPIVQLNPSIPASSPDKPLQIVVDNNGIVMYVGIESGLEWAKSPEYLKSFCADRKSKTQIFRSNHEALKIATEQLRQNPLSELNLLGKRIAEQKYIESCGSLGIINEILQCLLRLINPIAKDREKLIKLLFEIKKLAEMNI